MSTDHDNLALCGLDDIEDPGARGFAIERDGRLQDIFIVRRGEQVHGYVNKCPHTGGPLDWAPDQFIDSDQNLIQCATHDALFRIGDGFCVAGPCAGQSLTPVAIEVVKRTIRLARVEKACHPER